MRIRVVVHLDSEENSQASGSISTPEIHGFIVIGSFKGAETCDPTRLKDSQQVRITANSSPSDMPWNSFAIGIWLLAFVSAD